MEDNILRNLGIKEWLRRRRGLFCVYGGMEIRRSHAQLPKFLNSLDNSPAGKNSFPPKLLSLNYSWYRFAVLRKTP